MSWILHFGSKINESHDNKGDVHWASPAIVLEHHAPPTQVAFCWSHASKAKNGPNHSALVKAKCLSTLPHQTCPQTSALQEKAQSANHSSAFGISVLLFFLEQNHTELPALATVSSFVTLLQGSNAHCEGLNWALQLCKSWRMRGFCCSNFWIAQDIHQNHKNTTTHCHRSHFLCA